MRPKKPSASPRNSDDETKGSEEIPLMQNARSNGGRHGRDVQANIVGRARHERDLMIMGAFIVIIVFTGIITGYNMLLKAGERNLGCPYTEAKMRERERNLTVAFNLGVEGTGHHIWQRSSDAIWPTTTHFDSHVVANQETHLGPEADTDKVTKWLRSLNVMLQNVNGHATSMIDLNSYPHGSRDHYPNFTTFVERFNNCNEQHFGVHLQIRSVVTKRHLASTVASAIRRHFHPIEARPYRHWKGMRLIEEQVRSMSQDQWIMIDYEDFLLRPTEYAPILAKWFRVDNVTAFEMGLGAVKVRSPDRDIVQESWDTIRKWDAEHSGSLWNKIILNGFIMEEAVQEVMREWKADKDSIWNNECVVVSPENADFIEEGFECF